MKKILTLICTLLCANVLLAQVGTTFWIDSLQYEITSTNPAEVEVNDANSSITTAIIPSTVTYQGTTYSVITIGRSAFLNCSSLTSITIPNSVTSIGYRAFKDCNSLTSITIPNSVTSIGSEAFQDCSSLTFVTIGNSVTSIGDYAFRNCSSLTSVTIPNSVTSIGQSAFYNCSSLTSVTIPNSVTSIGNFAFQSCSSLTSLTIPNSVTSIGDAAFEDCSSLTSVDIPNSVTSIGESAFEDCSSLTSVTIGNGVTSIRNYTFSGCSSLTSVTCLKSNSPSLGYYVFRGTPNNKTLTIPCGRESEYTDWQNATTWASIDCILTIGSRFTIGDLTYEITSETELKVQACTQSATSVVIPETVTYQGTTYSVTSIGDGAFMDCSSLTSVNIPNSVTSIGYYAFENCSSLTSVDIPNSVTTIGGKAFYDCSSLTSVTIPNSVTTIGDLEFYNCSSLISVNIPNSVTSIGCGVFYNCSSLTSVTLSNNITELPCHYNSGYDNSDYGFFYNCSSLTSVDIPNSVTSIGNYAFRNCSSLTSVDIPNSVTSIGQSAFYNCSSLTSVTIPNSVTSIGDNTFALCSSLTSVTIPNSVTSIGGGVFADCSSLTSITIPNSVTSIGWYAFQNCSSLTSINIPNSVTSIGYYAFEDCSSLTSITIEMSNIVGDSTFYYYGNTTYRESPFNIPSLQNLTLGENVTSIGSGAFNDCSFLQNVTCLATTPPTIADNTVFPYPNIATLTVPCVSLEAYSLPTSLWNMFFSDRISGIEYNVEVSVNNDDFGSVAIENNCSTATLTATANACYQFVGWNDGNTENPRLVTLSSDTTLTANFEVMVVNNDITATICEGQVYNENGFNVSEAGTYTQTLQTINGCDSIVTLTLNVNPIYNTELSATICEGQAYTENNFNVSEAGVYTQTLTSVNGCDSIVTLTVSVNPTFDTTINATINPGETYAEFGFNESEAGTYVQNLQTEFGCDSTITLVLSVNSSLLEAETESISFYPNPTDSKITFSSTIESIEVIDLTGKTIFTFSNAKTINIESLPSGAYYLRLTNNDKAIMRKVIKQ